MCVGDTAAGREPIVGFLRARVMRLAVGVDGRRHEIRRGAWSLGDLLREGLRAVAEWWLVSARHESRFMCLAVICRIGATAPIAGRV